MNYCIIVDSILQVITITLLHLLEGEVKDEVTYGPWVNQDCEQEWCSQSQYTHIYYIISLIM